MSAEREPSDVGVESALRAVDRPSARPEFRSELRQRFLAAEAAARPRRSAPRFLGLLAAAAVLLAAGYFLLRPSASDWRVLEVAPGSVVKADGAVLPVDDAAALARYLRGAAEIEVERGDLVLQAGDLALFDLGEGTRVAFAGFDRDDRATPLALRATSGRLRGRTGPAFPGRTMQVQAGPMQVAVTGTAFAVDYEDVGTCLCCLHGTVQVAAKSAGMAPMPLEAGHMCLVFKDERAPLWGDAPAAHAEPIERLEARAREIWR
jgi:ferric-dicitrate binding protein FerR (iron transport regulator)